MANGTFEVSGGSTVAATTAFSGSHKGRMVELGGIRVPKAVRFRVEINFDRQVTLPSGKAARIEAEINGRSSRPAMAAPKPVTGVVMAR